MLYKPSPTTRRSTLWKQARSDALAATTGMRLCMSCRTLKPYQTVKRYRGMQRNVVMRCDACQALRLAVMRGPDTRAPKHKKD